MATIDVPVTITGYIRVHAVPNEQDARSFVLGENMTSHKFGIYDEDFLWIETIEVKEAS